MTSPTGVWFAPRIGPQPQKAWSPAGPSASLTLAAVWRWRGFLTTKVRNDGNEVWPSAAWVWGNGEYCANGNFGVLALVWFLVFNEIKHNAFGNLQPRCLFQNKRSAVLSIKWKCAWRQGWDLSKLCLGEQSYVSYYIKLRWYESLYLLCAERGEGRKSPACIINGSWEILQ